MKKFLSGLLVPIFFFAFTAEVMALTKEQAISQYRDELISIGAEPEEAETKAAQDVGALVNSMNQSQLDVDYSYESLADRVDSLLRNDGRKDDAESALESAEDKKDDFTGMEPESNIELQEAVAGALPRVLPGAGFGIAEEEALEALREVNRILLSPPRPGAVPEGDIVSDFIPQIIRQLFRFAWLAILIAFTVSGIMLITAHDNDEKITKAKQMIYYTLIGFAFIAMAFAVVKGVTDIDFFRII